MKISPMQQVFISVIENKSSTGPLGHGRHVHRGVEPTHALFVRYFWNYSIFLDMFAQDSSAQWDAFISLEFIIK